MAPIALRKYFSDIDNLINRERTDEAIAHCKYILRHFPKSVETYRLLGKAFLEAGRYTEAMDVFRRLLSSVPDDFIAHLGMSVIQEDASNLDAAIWHMERAFETQPYKQTIQNELRRLYEKRDGSVPPKVRLTQGALARMYAKSDLYTQAIGEIRSALSKESYRPDLQVLLTRMYYMSGKKVEAAEVANGLLKRLPMCYEANRILAAVLAGSERADEAAAYMSRLQALDPYEGYVSNPALTADSVQDAAVQLEVLSDTSELMTGASQPGWMANLGIDANALAMPDQDDLPDWLRTVNAGEGMSAPETGLANMPDQPEDELPEWLHTAGWQSGAGDTEQVETTGTDMDDLTQNDTGDDLEPADLPDWLTELPEPTIEDTQMETSEPEEEDEGLAALLASSSPQAASQALPNEEDELPDWLKDLGGSSADSPASQSSVDEESGPDWMQDFDAPTTLESSGSEPIAIENAPSPADEEELPDWLKDFDSPEPETAPGEITSFLSRQDLEAEAADINDEDLPDWLKDTSSEADDFDAPTQVGLPAIDPSSVQDAEAEEELPDWLADLSSSETPSPEDTGAPEVEEAEDLPDWLTDATAQAATIEPEPSPAEPAEDLPDWLKDAAPDEQVEDIAEPIPAEPAEELPDWLNETSTEQPALSLETGGAEPSEEMPEWLKESNPEAGETTTAQTSEDMQAGEPVEDLPDWLREVSAEEATLTPEASAAAPAEDLPDWLSGEEMASAPELEESTEDLPDWLKEAAPSAVSDESSTEDEEPTADFPDWLTESTTDQEAQPAPESVEPEELPDWLNESAAIASESTDPNLELPDCLSEAASTESDVDSDQEVPEWQSEEQPTTPAEELPDWLADAQPAAQSDPDQQEMPDWLTEILQEEHAKPIEPEAQTTVTAEETIEEIEFVEDAELPVAETSPEMADDFDQPTLVGPTAALDELPDWLKAFEDEEAPAEQSELIEDTRPTPAEPISPPAAELTVDDLLNELAGQPPAPELAESSGSVELESPPDFANIDEALAWLEALGAQSVANAEAGAVETAPELSVDIDAEVEASLEEAGEPGIGDVAITPEIEESLAELPQAIQESTDDLAAFLEAQEAEQPPILTDTQPTKTQAVESPAAQDTSDLPDEQLVEETIGYPEETTPPAMVVETESGKVELESPPDFENMDEALAWLTALSEKHAGFGEDATQFAPVDSEPVSMEAPEAAELEAEAGLPETFEAEELSPELTEEVEPIPSALPEVEQEAEATPIEAEHQEAVKEPVEEETPAAEPAFDDMPTMISVKPLPIDLNQASIAQLERLPGMNFALAQQVVNHRDQQGSFESVDDLLNVPGITPQLVQGLRERLTLPEPPPLPEPAPRHAAGGLRAAREALERGDQAAALQQYGALLDIPQMHGEIIFDLIQAVSRNPQSFDLWQSLGDAYLRSDRLQEALDAYSRAEELL